MTSNSSSNAGFYATTCPRGILDGYLIHGNALARGLSTWLLAGQVLYVGNSEGQELSFAHGVPEQTRLSAAVLSQDKRIRRALLADNGIKIPKGASFSLGDGLPGAKRYAKRLGYPVVVKPMIGENSIEVRSGIKGPKGLTRTFDYFRVAPDRRESFELSSYTLTTLFWPKDSDGQEARDDYRLLVESEVSGQYVRLFVIDGEVLHAMHAPGGTASPRPGGSDIGDVVHPSVVELGEKIAAIYPRIFAMTIDLVVNDFGASLEDQSYTVVELSERPWHYLRQMHLGDEVNDIAAYTLEKSAENSGFSIGAALPKPHIDARIQWDAVSDPKRFTTAYAEHAQTSGISGSIGIEDQVGGTVVAKVSGNAREIARLNELAVDSGLDRERAMSVKTSPFKVGASEIGADGANLLHF